MRGMTAEELRIQFDRVVGWFRSEPRGSTICNTAARWANDLRSVPAMQAARALRPAHLVGRVGAINPDTRDDAFNKKVERFIVAAYAALDELDRYEAAVASNATLTPAQCRERVLDVLARAGLEYTWLDNVCTELGLSHQQGYEAFEDLNRDSALEGQRSEANDFAWRARLSADGRRLARGERRDVPPFIHQEFHNSTIANAGTVHGDVTQNVTINPNVAELVAALEALRRTAGNEPQAAAITALANDAERELRTNGVTATASGLLMGLATVIQTVAALKPAYQTFQPIALAHGFPLPAWL